MFTMFALPLTPAAGALNYPAGCVAIGPGLELVEIGMENVTVTERAARRIGEILKKEPQRNDFLSAAATDLTIELVEQRAAGLPHHSQHPAVAPPKSLLARVFSR